MKVWKVFLLINFCLLFGFISSKAQVRVALKLDKSAVSWKGNSLFCDKNFNCGLPQTEKEKSGDNIIQAKVWRAGADFYLLLDTNQNNKLTGEKKIFLKSESKIIINIKRKLDNGKALYLPFQIVHEKEERKGQIVDYFTIFPHYAVAGALNYKNCSSKISLTDMNLDGNFNLSDAEGGSNFSIDRNNDGKIWGKGEFYKSNEIIEFCGQNFLVSSINNSELILSATDLQLAKFGETVPKFSFRLLNGEMITSENLKGKIFILDFWASWCVPCVENLPEIVALRKEYQDKLVIFSVNVDELSKQDLANKIINEKQLFDFSAIRGLGETDPLWKTFGGANLNGLSIPLYVLVDMNGTVRYIDKGGKNLTDLKSSISKLLTNR